MIRHGAYTFWVSRDLDNALRIWNAEPTWGETMWLRPTVTTWFRRLPSSLYPDLKPGEKLRRSLREPEAA